MSSAADRPVALVTGAAAGIGREVVRRLVGAGYLVGGYDVDTEGLARLADELGPRLRTGALDVRDPVQWQQRLEELTGGGALDVLVNNAGILVSGRFAEISLAAQQRLVEVNVTGVLNGCHTAWPYLVRAGSARVVNLASASAIYGQPELATYSATKFAVRGLTEALDLEWRRDGIRVYALWPLFVKTAMTAEMDIASVHALGIHTTPEQVAEEVLRLITDRRPHRLGSVHRAVGGKARAMLASSQVSPSWVLRIINRRIGTR